MKSRKIYDRGLIVGGSGTVFRDEEEDDPQTRFYKKREKRTHVPTPVGRTTVYNFDAWARAHYLHTKERQSTAREKFSRRTAATSDIFRRKEVDKLVTGFCIALLAWLSLYTLLFSEDYDVVRTNNSKKSKENS